MANEQELNEINLLTDKGLTFEVKRTISARPKGFIWRFRKPITKEETLSFTIKEATLGTLDRMAAEQIMLNLDESLLKSDASILKEARRLMHEHSGRMAKIVAIAVLGSDYLIQTKKGYKRNEKKLAELTQLFFENIKPSVLLELTIKVNAASNIAGFLNSIRLMSVGRTTMPNPVEVKPQA